MNLQILSIFEKQLIYGIHSSIAVQNGTKSSRTTSTVKPVWVKPCDLGLVKSTNLVLKYLKFDFVVFTKTLSRSTVSLMKSEGGMMHDCISTEHWTHLYKELYEKETIILTFVLSVDPTLNSRTFYDRSKYFKYSYNLFVS